MAPDGTELVPLPAHPDGVAWPTDEWPRGELPSGGEIEALVDELFDDESTYGLTYAVVIVDHGRLRLERYAHAIEHWDRADEPVDATTRLLSWSMAKSVLHAAVGIAVGDGLLDPSAAAGIDAWDDPNDPRRSITLDHLLSMRDGLHFVEDYIDGDVSHVIEMLFGSGSNDVAGFAASRPAAHPPGEVFNYSSGTSNIVARVLGDAIGGGRPGYESFLRSRLFEPIGMLSAEPRFDETGTFIGSSYVYATAQDFARFGTLYLRDGTWDGARILPEGWVDHGRRPRSIDPSDGRRHGAHWWVVGDEYGSFWASGYDGQSILIVPGLDLIAVRLGKTDASYGDAVERWRLRLIATVSG